MIGTEREIGQVNFESVDEKTIEHWANILVQANRISQGSPLLASQALMYATFFHPETRFKKRDIKAIRKQAEDFILEFILGRNGAKRHKKRDVTDIKYAVSCQASTLEASVQIPYKLSFCPLAVLEDITDETVLRDSKYVDCGRPHEGGDRYSSNLNYYGFQNHSTGTNEFDTMWERVVDVVLHKLTIFGWDSGSLIFTKEPGNQDPSPFWEFFPKLVRVWQEKHPGQDFFTGRLSSFERRTD